MGYLLSISRESTHRLLRSSFHEENNVIRVHQLLYSRSHVWIQIEALLRNRQKTRIVDNSTWTWKRSLNHICEHDPCRSKNTWREINKNNAGDLQVKWLVRKNLDRIKQTWHAFQKLGGFQEENKFLFLSAPSNFELSYLVELSREWTSSKKMIWLSTRRRK